MGPIAVLGKLGYVVVPWQIPRTRKLARQVMPRRIKYSPFTFRHQEGNRPQVARRVLGPRPLEGTCEPIFAQLCVVCKLRLLRGRDYQPTAKRRPARKLLAEQCQRSQQSPINTYESVERLNVARYLPTHPPAPASSVTAPRPRDTRRSSTVSCLMSHVSCPRSPVPGLPSPVACRRRDATRMRPDKWPSPTTMVVPATVTGE